MNPLPESSSAPGESPSSGRAASTIEPSAGWPSNYPWAVFVVPFVVFMVVGSLEPSAGQSYDLLGATVDFSYYPLIYCVKIAATLLAMALVWPGYRQFSWRVSPWALLVGAVGVVLWIGICLLDLESRLLGPLGLGAVVDLGQRAAFDPLSHWPGDLLRTYGFLAVRFLGLALVVPVIEEFFIRGFVMRFVVHADWPRVPFGTLTPAAAIAGTLVPVLMHPAEVFAALVWFTLITWLMFKTRNIWDCVAAHAVTNLLLGIYVVATGQWRFW